LERDVAETKNFAGKAAQSITCVTNNSIYQLPKCFQRCFARQMPSLSQV
jgi:hypothetical protein